MILYVVVPCYNEEDVLPETAKRLRSKMNDLTGRGVISEESRVLFVNDGSKDDTWNIIRKLHEENPLFQGLSLSRNRGHQNALLAGLMTAKDKCDACISMDADLQDDINAMDEMIEQYTDGCDVVYGIRNHRDADSFFKRSTAILFYRVMNWMGVQMVSNHADYRLMSRRALNGLAEFREVNLFLRGIVPMIGYKAGEVYYDRAERFAGESKYPFNKMVAFAMDGITSWFPKDCHKEWCFPRLFPAGPEVGILFVEAIHFYSAICPEQSPQPHHQAAQRQADNATRRHQQSFADC